jgi:superfamily I DNA and/or RNA helicase
MKVDLTDDTTVVDRKDKDSIFRAALGSLFPASTPHHTVFLNVLDGKLFTARKGGSKANPVYAAAVQRVVNRLIAKGARKDSIGILTFYQAQRHLHDLFSSPSVQVVTVDASQGREFDFVVLDLVTPGGKRYGLGFVAEPTRINVDLSRAKHGLVIVGSKVMADLKHQNKGPKIWAEIIRSHVANGALQTVSADGRRFEEKLSLKQYFCK